MLECSPSSLRAFIIVWWPQVPGQLAHSVSVQPPGPCHGAEVRQPHPQSRQGRRRWDLHLWGDWHMMTCIVSAGSDIIISGDEWDWEATEGYSSPGGHLWVLMVDYHDDWGDPGVSSLLKSTLVKHILANEMAYFFIICGQWDSWISNHCTIDKILHWFKKVHIFICCDALEINKSDNILIGWN